jgi:P-type Ca2+ transporter type 2C
MAVIYVPFSQRVFETRALTMGQLAITLALSSVVFDVVEISKIIARNQDALRESRSHA